MLPKFHKLFLNDMSTNLCNQIFKHHRQVFASKNDNDKLPFLSTFNGVFQSVTSKQRYITPSNFQKFFRNHISINLCNQIFKYARPVFLVAKKIKTTDAEKFSVYVLCIICKLYTSNWNLDYSYQFNSINFHIKYFNPTVWTIHYKTRRGKKIH